MLPPPAADPSAAEPDMPIRRIVLIEDNAMAATIVRSVFAAQSCLIDHFETLEAGLAFLQSPQATDVEMALLDLTLPDSAGLDTLRRYRSVAPTLPVVVLTGSEDEATGLAALRMGADDYLIKDEVYPRLLRRHARYAVERKRQHLALHAAKEQAESATSLKDKFVNLVAHDIRSPLSAIIGNVELLLTKDDMPRDRQKAILERTSKDCWHIETIVRDVLDLARLHSGKIDLRRHFFDAHYMVADAMAHVGPAAEAKGLSLCNDVPEYTRLFADLALFAQVLQNLLTNAVKFSRPGGRIRAYVPAGTPATIAIEDQGVGIPESRLPRLFDIGTPTSTRGTAGERGTGFGLPLSRDILRAHQGDLTVESGQDRGSTFYARLPAVTPQVLIVDDEQMQRLLMRALLEGIAAEIMEAGGGEAALALMERQPLPHLILTDMMMPDLDGLALLERIKSHPRFSAIPVIMVTGETDAASRERALRLGATDFIAKPITPQDFLPRVRQVIG